MTEINLRERRLSLELIMPIAALSALLVGAVVASAQTKPAQKVELPPAPPPVEMEDEEIVTEIASEAEPEVIESPSVPVTKPTPVKRAAPAEELGTSKLEMSLPEGAVVWLGKKKLGEAPIEKMEVVEGRYLIKVELGDSTFSEWVDIPPGGTFAYRLSLETDSE